MTEPEAKTLRKCLGLFKAMGSRTWVEITPHKHDDGTECWRVTWDGTLYGSDDFAAFVPCPKVNGS